jgi:hypothetical protein
MLDWVICRKHSRCSEVIQISQSTNLQILRDRLTVGRQTLNLQMGVRILLPQYGGLNPSAAWTLRGSRMGKTSDSESGDCRFESCPRNLACLHAVVAKLGYAPGLNPGGLCLYRFNSCRRHLQFSIW